MKKFILCILAAGMLIGCCACDSADYVEIPETTIKPVASQDVVPSSKPTTLPPQTTPATATKSPAPTKTPVPTKTPSAPGWAVTLDEYAGGNYAKAISEVTDKNVRITPDFTNSFVQSIAIMGDCNFTILGLGYGMPYSDTTRRLAEKYGDPVHSTDTFCEFEVNDEYTTISISTNDGKTVSFVEMTKKLA